MDRERWSAFIEEGLLADVPIWPAPPSVPGRWRTLPPEDGLHLLLDLTQAQLAADRRPVCELYGPRAVRARVLACLPGHLLAEAWLHTEEGPGLLSFVYGRSGVWVLDFTPDTMHAAADQIGLDLSEASAAAEYLQLYCGHLRGSKSAGRFRIVEQLQQIPLEQAEDEQTVEIAERLASIRLERGPRPAAEGEALGMGASPADIEGAATGEASTQDGAPEIGWLARATTLFDGSLFEGRYFVASDGRVAMIEDEVLLEALPVRRERFMGGLRLP